jgi:hypothetical protein
MDDRLVDDLRPPFVPLQERLRKEDARGIAVLGAVSLPSFPMELAVLLHQQDLAGWAGIFTGEPLGGSQVDHPDRDLSPAQKGGDLPGNLLRARRVRLREDGRSRTLREEIDRCAQDPPRQGRHLPLPCLLLEERGDPADLTNETVAGAFFEMASGADPGSGAGGRMVRKDDCAGSLARNRPTHSCPPGEAAAVPNIRASFRSPAAKPRSYPYRIDRTASLAAARLEARRSGAVSFEGVGASRIFRIGGHSSRRASSSFCAEAIPSQFLRGASRDPDANSRTTPIALGRAADDEAYSSASPIPTAAALSTGSLFRQISAAFQGPEPGRRHPP